MGNVGIPRSRQVPRSERSLPPSDPPARCRSPGASCARAPHDGAPAPRDYSWAPLRLPPQTSTGRPVSVPVYGPTFPPRLSGGPVLVEELHSRAYQVCTAPAVGGAWAQWTIAAILSCPGPGLASSGSWRPPGPAPVGSDAPGGFRARGTIVDTRHRQRSPESRPMGAQRLGGRVAPARLHLEQRHRGVDHPPQPRQRAVPIPAGLVNVTDGCPPGLHRNGLRDGGYIDVARSISPRLAEARS